MDRFERGEEAVRRAFLAAGSSTGSGELLSLVSVLITGGADCFAAGTAAAGFRVVRRARFFCAMGAATYTKAWLVVVGSAEFEFAVRLAAVAAGSGKVVDATATVWSEASPMLAWSGSISAGYTAQC